MRKYLFLRMTGMITFFALGFWTARNGLGLAGLQGLTEIQIGLIFGILLGIFGFICTPLFFFFSIRVTRKMLKNISALRMIVASSGVIFGLIIAALLTIPLAMIPGRSGQVLPIIAMLVFPYLGLASFLAKDDELGHFVSAWYSNRRSVPTASTEKNGMTVLLDTSVIIDGRLAEIGKTGFLPQVLLVPNFVLQELQYIADSEEPMRRSRGRRGLDVLSTLQSEALVKVKISNLDVPGTRDVDAKLIVLARQLNCAVLTNDYNLNKVAELQGVAILNVNDLANAVKSVLLPGESLRITVIQEGKEYLQGVGYLPDGTMVVIENGRTFLNQELDVIVTKVLQTTAGRMIFARPERENGSKR